MKPVKLAIEGINSFTDRQELDFDAVGRSNLFCICGKTGAGKTTIFDSIMFALYGTSNRGTLADMVNLSLMRAKVEFEFISGADIYKVERTIKCRAKRDEKKKKGDTEPLGGAKRDSTTECMLYKNGEPIANGGNATEMLAEVIGLDKDEFKNVYMLEQGEYAEFLKKTPAKQTEAIGKIFSLLRYDEVHKRAKQKAENMQRDVDGFDRTIAVIGEDAPEILRAVTAEHASLRSKTAALKTSVEKSRAELDKLTKERDGYLSYIEKANALRIGALRLDEAKKALAEAENAFNDFAAGDEKDEANKQTLKKLRDEQNKLAELNAWDCSLVTAGKELEEKTAAIAACKTEAERARAQMLELETNAEKAKTAFTDAVNKFTESVGDGSDKSAGLERACDSLSGSERKVSMVGELKYALEKEYADYKTLTSRCDEQKRRIAELNELVNSATTKIQAYAVELKNADERLDAADNNVKACEKKLLRAQTESRAAAICAELNDGDTCPVCGGVYRGGAHCDGADTRVDECKARLDEAVNAKKLAENEKRNIERASEKVKSDFERAADEKEKAERAVAELDKNIAELKVTDSHAEYIELLDNARTLGERYVEAANRKRDGEPAAAKLFAELEAGEKSKAEIEARIADLRKKLGDNAGKTASALADIKERIAALDGEITARDRTRNELKGKCDSARAIVEAHTVALEQAKRDCPVDMPEFDEDKYNEKKSQYEALMQRLHECERDAAVKESEIKEYTEKCATLSKVKAERSESVKKHDNYSAIADLTKNKSMLNFVVAEYMAEITNTASEILSVLSSGKYLLTYDGESGFTVTDYLSGGGKRKASTLSGGEMFLASLSVAIAIARAQSKGNNAFFFLDEGFGTLDDELIDTVFAALDILSKDCLVGVISHASALIERMPMRVEVGEATDTRGSTISY